MKDEVVHFVFELATIDSDPYGDNVSVINSLLMSSEKIHSIKSLAQIRELLIAFIVNGHSVNNYDLRIASHNQSIEFIIILRLLCDLQFSQDDFSYAESSIQNSKNRSSIKFLRMSIDELKTQPETIKLINQHSELKNFVSKLPTESKSEIIYSIGSSNHDFFSTYIPQQSDVIPETHLSLIKN